MARSAEIPSSTFVGLPSVTKLSLPDQVFSTLRDALMCGRFEPGQRVPLRTIAQALGTSTMPAREAVNRLIATGALEALPNRRVSVPFLNAERYQDIANTRVIVESATAAAATPRLENSAIEELGAIHADMRIALRKLEEPGGHGAYLDLNKRFHFIIYQASGSVALLAIIETLWLQVGPYLNLALEQSRDWFKTDQHLPILDAVRSRDPAAVSAAIKTNISYAAEFVIASGHLDRLAADIE